MVKCSQCKYPVEKSFGCNNITCSVCRTNFNYVTGEKCVAGNHTTDSPIAVKSEKSILKDIISPKSNPELYELLVKFNGMKPQTISFNSVINLMVKLKDAGRVKHVVAMAYEKYMLNRIKLRTYYKLCEELFDGELTIPKMNKILSLMDSA
jgi:hypothetical protein